MAGVRLEGVTKRFGSVTALDDVSITIEEGELLALVGPSGGGKSTALRVLAGFERPTKGIVSIGDRVVNDVSPQGRNIAMVFQNYALFPHMTVYKNLAFGMKVRREPRSRIRLRVAEVAETLGIGDLLDRRPDQLSGGQRQRVAVGRALLREPDVFLLDEPLSNLDAALRTQMRIELARLHERVGATMVYVTHDQVEAMTLGDRIAILHEGLLQQIGRPEEIYDTPTNLFVAGFIGSPKMNLLPAELSTLDGRVAVRTHDVTIPLEAETARAAANGRSDRSIVVGLRPEDLSWAHGDTADLVGTRLAGSVSVIEPLGAETFVVVDLRSGSVTARFPPRAGIAVGDHVSLVINHERLHLFDTATGTRLLGDLSERPPRGSTADRGPHAPFDTRQPRHQDETTRHQDEE